MKDKKEIKDYFVETLNRCGVKYTIYTLQDKIGIYNKEYSFYDEYVTESNYGFHFVGVSDDIKFEFMSFKKYIDDLEKIYIRFLQNAENFKLTFNECEVYVKHNFLEKDTDIYIYKDDKLLFTVRVTYFEHKVKFKKKSVIVYVKDLDNQAFIDELSEYVYILIKINNIKNELRDKRTYLKSDAFKRVFTITSFFKGCVV